MFVILVKQAEHLMSLIVRLQQDTRHLNWRVELDVTHVGVLRCAVVDFGSCYVTSDTHFGWMNEWKCSDLKCVQKPGVGLVLHTYQYNRWAE